MLFAFSWSSPGDSKAVFVVDIDNIFLTECSHDVPGFPAIACFAIVDLTRETPELEQLRRKVKDTVDE